jgi:hypothetical protein
LWNLFDDPKGFHKTVASIPGVANPRHTGRMWSRKEFLRPNLGLKLGNFSIFWVYLLSFGQNAAQKVIIFGNFLKCASETNLGWPPLV